MEGFQNVARQFINTTRNHLFLTGKAGTGKTTFLKSLSGITHKNFIVVAPTGIAALNAGGVTIHSQFLLPFGTFIPDKFRADNFTDSQPFYTQNTLARNHPLNSSRRQVLRSIDLLVIDEVSMLRADLLDAIDYRMKSVRGNHTESFGGVQVLFIGDLYQLPPVVKREDEQLLRQYYKTPWFYEAKALEKDPLVIIELDKIYRQHDYGFIDLLNNLRNNLVTDADITLLNSHYKTEAEINSLQEVVTLTTHNYKADEINSTALKALKTVSRFFEAKTEGDFPDHIFPVLRKIELKVGAQIMFVRNDIDGAYFNGKLATVIEMSGEDVWVEMATSHTKFKLKREQWQNKKYSLGEDRELEEEVVGTFEQFPVKLAWAITVHKSQGLTFEKAIIDVAEAFADGQVYVALSRLRSLDGLVLRTKIHPGVISTDKNVVQFVEARHKPEDLGEKMKTGQKEFVRILIEKAFDFSSIIRDLRHIIKQNSEGLVKEDVVSKLEPIAFALESERSNTEKFRRQLQGLLDQDRLAFDERIAKGSEYYRKVMNAHLKTVLYHLEEVKRMKRVNAYLNQLTELDGLLTKKLSEIDNAQMLATNILNGGETFSDPSLDARRAEERNAMLMEIRENLPVVPSKKKGRKRKKGEPSTHDVSISMLKKGMSVLEIAGQRGLAAGTIEGHLVKGLLKGAIEITEFVDNETIFEVSNAVETATAEIEVKELYHRLKKRYSHTLLRAILHHKGMLKNEVE
jgi:hypothetical protein